MALEDEYEVVTPVHKSLVKENLFMGCEPQLLMATGAIFFIFVVIVQNLITSVIMGFAAVAAIPILRAIARRDPIYSQVYMRNRRYRGHYNAHPNQHSLIARPDENYQG